MNPTDADPHLPDARRTIARVLTGLAQGGLIWWLVQAEGEKRWPAIDQPLYSAFILMALAVPPVLLGALGILKPRPLLIWAGSVTILCLGVGWLDGYRALSQSAEPPSPPVMLGIGIGLFVAQSLLVGAAVDQRRLARYQTYFDVAWKYGVQIVLAAGFTGVFWLVLLLGAALFGVIGLKGFGELLGQTWFSIPATTTAFAAAVQLTDVRTGLIRGVRTVAMTLLGWLTPLLAGLGLAFLLALPFTDLAPLWATRSATAILLGSAAALILLANAAYQDGGRDRPVPAILGWAIRLAGLLLAPLAGLAAYALLLRIGQHGLTVDRIVAAACALIALCYAVGYGVAAVSPGPAMRRIEPVNIGVAFLSVAVILALLSPVADPVRLSVGDQMARLKSGKVQAAAFDYGWLRFEAGRYGKQALNDLVRQGGETGRLAAQAAAAQSREALQPGKPEKTLGRLPVYPVGQSLPQGFGDAVWNDLPWGCQQQNQACALYVIDLDGDRQMEVLAASQNGEAKAFSRSSTGFWSVVGDYDLKPCSAADLRDHLRQGRFKTTPGRWKDLEFGGARFPMMARKPDCPAS